MPRFGIVETTQRWADVTATPLPEIRNRVKCLRLAGMLPDGRIDMALGDGLTGHFLIAAMCSERNDMAPEALKRYASLTCVNTDTEFSGMTLSAFMEDTLKRSRIKSNPFQIVYATFNLSRPLVEILVIDTRRTENIGAVLVFGDLSQPTSPIENVRRLSGRVIEGMGRGE